MTAAGRDVFRVSPETAWRWALKGVGGIKLESIKIGGMRYTSREACDRFLAALNDGHAPASGSPPRRSSRAEAAARRLDTIGM